MRNSIRIILIIGVAICPDGITAQKPEEAPTQPQVESPFLGKMKTRIEQATRQVSAGDSGFENQYTKLGKINMLAEAEAATARYQYQKETWLYYTNSLKYRSKVFDWQHFSAQITFGIAILIVFCGLGFSGIQFWIAMREADLRYLQAKRTRKLPEEIKHQIPSTGVQTTVKMSLQGVEVNSSILGVIILAISLAFFYLYLVYVFPINETNLDVSGLRTERQLIEELRKDK